MTTIFSAFLGAISLYMYLIKDLLMFKITIGTILFAALLEIVFDIVKRLHDKA